MSTGQLLASLDLTKGAHLWQHPGLLCHRASIHKILRVAATSTDGIGPPVKLHLTSGVSDVDVNTNVVRLENGSTFTGDFVVGADGVKVSYGAASSFSLANDSLVHCKSKSILDKTFSLWQECLPFHGRAKKSNRHHTCGRSPDP